MMFFKPEDFPIEFGQHDQSLAAHAANVKLQEEGRVFYSYGSQDLWYSENEAANETKSQVDSVKGVLINIEPLEKCDHPVEKVESYSFCHDPKSKYFKCECGSVVRPQKFYEVEE